ncbi:MAG: VCBS repeat-containing protein [Bryobacterales bacterium]
MNLPKHALSLGDAEFGDADLDGDLDLVLVDWGADNPMKNDGAVLLWLNDGQGKFTPAPAGAVPDKKIRFSWDIEFADVDNDFDLDLMVTEDDRGRLVEHQRRAKAFTDETEARCPEPRTMTSTSRST